MAFRIVLMGTTPLGAALPWEDIDYVVRITEPKVERMLPDSTVRLNSVLF